mmetsp:Transcript_17606/g.21352  ORF Transcript_17606/g.21352 Transcript_17606/m.21352 type:complete len:428 (+) Transcript_17606:455-1738(+)
MFFQLFNLTTFKPRFKCEVYEGMPYVKHNEKLHSFEIEECVAGFAFADRNDANRVFQIVNSQKPKVTVQSTNTQSSAQLSKLASSAKVSKQQQKKAKKPKAKKEKKKKKGKGGFEEFQVIGFKQNAHVGMKEDGSFDLKNIPSEWKKLFRQAGIRPKDLKNVETAKEIIGLIEEDDWRRKKSEANLGTGEYVAEAVTFNDEEREMYRLQQEQMDLYKQHQAGLAAWEQANSAILRMPTPELPPRRAKHTPQEPPEPPPEMIARSPSLTPLAFQEDDDGYGNDNVPPPPRPDRPPPADADVNSGGLADMLKNIQLKKTEPVEKPITSAGGVSADMIRNAKLKKVELVEKPPAPPSAHDIFLKEIMERKLKKTVIPPKLPDAERFNAGRKNSLVRKLQDAMTERRNVFLNNEDGDSDDDSDNSWSDIED